MISFPYLGIYHLPLNISMVRVILVICPQNDLKHVVEQFVLFVRFGNCRAWLDVRVLIYTVWFYTINDTLREND